MIFKNKMIEMKLIMGNTYNKKRGYLKFLR